jgi:hypothetical protein
MSPEQALGQRVDPRSDLFSLGCVVYAMCTGQAPFRGDNWPAVIKQVCDEAPRPITQINPEVPAWLVATVDRLLAKDPAQRFQSAADVAEVLAGQLALIQAGQVPSAAVARAGAVPAATPPVRSPLFSAWLFVALVVTGYTVGRILPLGDLQAVIALIMGAVVSGVVFMRRSRVVEASTSITALLVLISFIGYMGGLAFGRDAQQIAGMQAEGVGWLILGLAALLAGHAVWHFRRVSSVAISSAGTGPLPQGSSGQQDRKPGSVARPFRIAPWLLVAMLLCFLLLPCVIWLGILVPAYQATEARQTLEANKAVLSVRFDEETPLVELERSPVFANPAELRRFPGRHVLTMTYLSSGQR